MSVSTTTEQRFWAKVEKTNACWLWQGTKSADGYGRFRVSENKRLEAAHRYAYGLLVGPIPEGLTLDHLCRNPGCVNPDHLEPVTLRENILRSDGLPARNARKTHCDKGHPFSAENTYLLGGKRHCRQCGRDRKNQWSARRRERVAA